MHQEPSAERIHRKERSHAINEQFRLLQRRFWCLLGNLDGGRQRPIEQERQQPQDCIEAEHELHRNRPGPTRQRAHDIRKRSCQDAERRPARSDDTVTRKERGSVVRFDGLAEHGLLERGKNACITGSRVHRPDKGDDEEWPEISSNRKSGARRRHQHRCRKKKKSSGMSVCDPSDPQGQKRCADQRAGHYGANRKCAEPQFNQVDRQ